jgi:excisionase family DNA binding protein
MLPQNRLSTTEEVASYLGVPKATLYAWRTRGIGPRAVRIGRHLRFRAQDVEEYVDEQYGLTL